MSWGGIRREIAQMLNLPTSGQPAQAGGLKIINLIDNPSIETDTTGYSGSTITIARDTTVARYGSASLRVTYSASLVERLTIKQRDGSRFPVTAGQLYTFSHDYKPDASSGGGFHSDIAWYDSGGAELSKIFGEGYQHEDASVVSVSAGDNWRRTFISDVAPINAVTAELRIEENAGFGAGEILYFDGLMFNQGDYLGYIDGDQPGCFWTNEATPNVVTSYRPIMKVHLNPPTTIQETPCAIIIPPALETTRFMGGLRQDVYTVRIRILAADAEQDDAAGLVDAFRDRLLQAVDAAVALGGAATTIMGQRFEEGVGFQYPVNSGKVYAGFDCLLTVEEKSDVTYVL